MSTDTKPATKPAAAPSDGTKWFPVRKITFCRPTSVPGGAARTDLAGHITQQNVARWTIEYAPSMRHFKVTHYTTDPSKEPQIAMIPETNVNSWEPMQ